MSDPSPATLNTQRFLLAVLTVAGLIAAGVGVFMVLSWGKEITAVIATLVTLLIREIGAEAATAFAWFFDGSADKPPPAAGTSTTTASTVIEPVEQTPQEAPITPQATSIPPPPVGSTPPVAPAKAIS